MSLTHVVPVFGPPTAGKTTLTTQLAERPGVAVFRLREHVPTRTLVSTATTALSMGWIDHDTVEATLNRFLRQLDARGCVHTVLLDNFPGNGAQVNLLVKAQRLLPTAFELDAVELVADSTLIQQRAMRRRVCRHCEPDPAHDPRRPAAASQSDPTRCAACGHLLHLRRGDAPDVLAARAGRYDVQAGAIRAVLDGAGIRRHQIPADKSIGSLVSAVASLLRVRSVIT